MNERHTNTKPQTMNPKSRREIKAVGRITNQYEASNAPARQLIKNPNIEREGAHLLLLTSPHTNKHFLEQMGKCSRSDSTFRMFTA